MDTPGFLVTSRVLPDRPLVRWSEYESARGSALDAAGRLGSDGVVEHLLAAGLRGRGGAGFPTGRKWAAVIARESMVAPPTVVVNAAEGEPGSFKDRAILRADPHAVLEGAVIAAITIGADRVIIALKASFLRERALVDAAIAERRDAFAALGVDVLVHGGPGEYLYGEETGLLEAIEGRPPFPRVAPPYRHGVDEVGAPGSPQPAEVVMADHTDAPPTLVNNAETMANVPGIITNGPAWFRQVGTDASPGTIVCTIAGATVRAGVAEVEMGTPLRDVIDGVGGGASRGRRIVAAMSGVANALITEAHLDTPLSYEAMEAIGSGLGAGGFIVFDDETDFAAVAAGVSRFLAVESCGQCTPCKQDGMAIADLLRNVRDSSASDHDLDVIGECLVTVADGARCSLALQHQRVVGSIVAAFDDQLRAHVDGRLGPVAASPVSPLRQLEEGEALVDERELQKQPDWTFDALDSGKTPAERLGTDRAPGDRVTAEALERRS